MRYKDDWETAKKRLTAFWERDIIDRCCAAVQVIDRDIPDPFMHSLPGTPEEWFAYRTDPELVIKRNRLRMEHTYFGGEAFPQIFIDLGAAGHAGFFKNAKYSIRDSVWFFPALNDMRDVEFDPHSFLYKRTLEMAEAYVEDSKGDYMVSMPDSTGNMDALSHLFGPEFMMEEMLDNADEVSGALKKIECAYETVMRGVYERVKVNNEGGSCVGWLSTWAPGMHAQMQSDMSVMISNRMFETFVMPELKAQCDLLDYPLYHFDGMEQIRHLDSLLSLEKLRCIQWTQVDGQPSCLHFIPELRRIQQAGKNLVILIRPEQAEPLLDALSSRGLYLVTTVDSVTEAEEFIKNVSKHTKD